MKKFIAGITLFACFTISLSGWGLSEPKETGAGHYVPPHPGLVSRKFMQLPVGAVRPEGWLKRTLQAWADGITGHVHEYRSETFWNTWDNRRYRNKHREKVHRAAWWPFEQQAYWADGLVQTAYILDDERLKKIADKFTDGLLAGQNPDGYMGMTPDKPYSDKADIYVQSELTRSLMSYYSATGNQRIIPAMQRAFRHIHEYARPSAEAQGWGRPAWSSSSRIIAAVLWVYSETGDRHMMDLANLIFSAIQKTPSAYQRENLLLDGDTLYDLHGVGATETVRVPALYYLYSGNPNDLNATIKAIESIDRYHGQVHGGPASDEHLREIGAVNNTENCVHTTYSATKQTMFSITGEVKYADGVERIVFNVGPGSRMPNGRAMQYYTAPNQVVCTRTSCNAPDIGLRHHRQLFCPDGDPDVQCCVGESTRLYPNYLKDAMWLASHDDGLAAACYGPCSVRAKVGESGKVVTIEEKTNYPFEKKILFVVKSSEPVKFPLYLRIPGWCKDASIKINCNVYRDLIRPGKMVRIERTWRSGDNIELNLPMRIALSRWDKGSVAVERGPLVYALKIRHNWKKVGERFLGFPDWEVRAGTDWNYALCFNLNYGKECPIDSYFTVKHLKVPEGSYPWEYPHIELACKGKKVDGWEMIDSEVTPDVPQSPVVSENPEETVTLVPYGCTRIRITYFPVVELN